MLISFPLSQYLLLALYIHTFTTYLGLSSRLTTYLPFVYPLPLLGTILYGAVIHSQVIATVTNKSIPLTPDQNFQIWQSNIPSRYASAILYGIAAILFVYT